MRDGTESENGTDTMSNATVVVVTSGKGGVGKTTTTAAIASALAKEGYQVCAIDFDVGLRNLDLIMGAERRVVFDLVNVVRGEASIKQALVRDKKLNNLYLLPASQTRDKDALTEEGVDAVISELRMYFDWVICDSPAGIERGATLAMRHADEAIIVSNPEVSSVRDCDRIIGLLDAKTKIAEEGGRMPKHLMITRYDTDRAKTGDMLATDDVVDILRAGVEPRYRRGDDRPHLGERQKVSQMARVQGGLAHHQHQAPAFLQDHVGCARH